VRENADGSLLFLNGDGTPREKKLTPDLLERLKGVTRDYGRDENNIEMKEKEVDKKVILSKEVTIFSRPHKISNKRVEHLDH